MVATLLYECDPWHSTNSMVLMGVFTERKPLVKAVCSMIRERLRDNFIPDEYEEEDLREDYYGCRNDLARKMFKDWKRYGQTSERVNVQTIECELNEYGEI